MERFLAECAKYIYTKHENELPEICVVFPNRRAGVFFVSYLQNEIKKPVIAPQITTIGQLISDNSERQIAERLHLISILYDVFKKHTHTAESFDDFYFWGEILLTDFNDVDRYLVNAKDLFRNISDIKEIESVFDYLTPEQKKALEYFWGSVLNKDNKEFEKNHKTIWEKLYPIYSEFRDVLIKSNLGYSGMIDREVVENIEKYLPAFSFGKYYVVGLNALNACEKKLFSVLQKEDKIEFLWDFDNFYVDDPSREAGRFLCENLKKYPPPTDFSFNTEFFSKNKDIKLVAVSSNFGQSQQIPLFLNETSEDFAREFDNTAVVLADESLLFSSLGAIPPETGTVNVTMGYPVKNSVIYGFLMLLATLLKNIRKEEKRGVVAYHRFVTDILNHQLLETWKNDQTTIFLEQLRMKNQIAIPLKEIDFTPIHSLVFQVPEKVEDYSDYFLKVLGVIYQNLKTEISADNMLPEIIYTIYQSLEKLSAVIKNVTMNQKREISKTVYFRLFSQFLGNVSVAFEGEPLSGIQVMGILETRCLDFKNLIILGLNENKWPRTFTAPSFIPHNIRKGFGLPGIDEQDAMYAYYFYRLIQRAENITATYSVLKEGINTGELSRYGYQLQYDSSHHPERLNLDFRFANEPPQPITVRSSKNIVQKLLEKNSENHPLSPSAINTYLQCSLKFFFRYVAELPEPDEIKEEIDGMIFGNIFHDTVEALYRPFVGKEVSSLKLENLRKEKILIENEIRKKIAKNYFKEDESKLEKVFIEGKSVLIYENVKTYLNRLFEIDKNISPFSITELEKKYSIPMNIKVEGQPVAVYTGGIIDRIDKVHGKTRVLDYKTGSVTKSNMSFSAISQLFEKDKKDPKKEILQALIYTLVLSKNLKTKEIQPVIYSLQNFFADDYNPVIKFNRSDVVFADIEDDFVQHLKLLMTEIFSCGTEFLQTPVTEHCEYCPYREICQRYKV